jgi:hypothetical protein
VTLPLTFGQKMRLSWGSLKLALVLLPFFFYLRFVPALVGRPGPLFYVLILALVLFVGYDSLRCFRDLKAGVVVVTDDVLVKSRASRGPGRQFFGEFRMLGKVRMTAKAHFGGRNGAVHRVTYSPISKFVWTAEPKAPYR